MNNLKTLLVRNTIINNDLENNRSILNTLIDLRFDCGCKKYYIKDLILYLDYYQCKLCKKNVCRKYYYTGTCLDCVKKYQVDIDYYELGSFYMKLIIDDKKIFLNSGCLGGRSRNISYNEFLTLRKLHKN